MNQLEDLLRDAYGEERFTMTVPEIEARAHKARRRRTAVTLAVAGGLAVAMVMVYVALPRSPVKPPITWPMPSASETQPARPVSRVNECRAGLTKDGPSTLRNVEAVEVIDDREMAYIFADGNAMYICWTLGSVAIEPHLVTALSRTAPEYTVQETEGRGLIAGWVPYGMRRVEYFDGAGTMPLASNGTVFYGIRPPDHDFNGVKATAEEVFTAHATLMRDGPATTRADQQAACRAAQLRMPVPDTELSLLDSREADSQTWVLLLAGADGLLAVCTVYQGASRTQVGITVANHPIYHSLLEQKDTTQPMHRAVVLLRRFPGDLGKGRVVLSNGQRVPLVFADGHAIAWFDRPDGVQADHLEVDTSSGGQTDYPLPLRG